MKAADLEWRAKCSRAAYLKAIEALDTAKKTASDAGVHADKAEADAEDALVEAEAAAEAICPGEYA